MIRYILETTLILVLALVLIKPKEELVWVVWAVMLKNHDTPEQHRILFTEKICRQVVIYIESVITLEIKTNSLYLMRESFCAHSDSDIVQVGSKDMRSSDAYRMAYAVFVDPRVYGALMASSSCLLSVKLFNWNWMLTLSLKVKRPTWTPFGFDGEAMSSDAMTFVTNCVSLRKLSSPMLPEASRAKTMSADPAHAPKRKRSVLVTGNRWLTNCTSVLNNECFAHNTIDKWVTLGLLEFNSMPWQDFSNKLQFNDLSKTTK